MRYEQTIASKITGAQRAFAQISQSDRAMDQKRGASLQLSESTQRDSHMHGQRHERC
jgi:hypothetical protein